MAAKKKKRAKTNVQTADNTPRLARAAAYTAGKGARRSAFRGEAAGLAKRAATDGYKCALEELLETHADFARYVNGPAGHGSLNSQQVEFCANWGIAAMALLKDLPPGEADRELRRLLNERADLGFDEVSANVIGG